MSKTYLIQWKSSVNGRVGKGTKFFDREEAERLARELNQEYPEIAHEVIETSTTVEAPRDQRPTEPTVSQSSPPAAESASPALDPVAALSV